jgi:hypothetical protein
VVYNSNYDLQTKLGYPTEYSDVYLMTFDGGGSPAPGPAPTPAPTPEPTPETTVTRHEQSDPSVQRTGSWYPYSKASYSDGSAIRSRDHGTQVRFTFTGTDIQWIGNRDQWSGVAQVYLDGAFMATIDTHSATKQAQAVLYSAGGLSNATHELAVVVTADTTAPSRSRFSSGGWVWVDAFDVTAESNSTTEPTPSPETPSAPIRIEQTDPSVAFSGGAWFNNTGAPNSGGSQVLSMDANARATLTFTGRAVSWRGYRDEWSGIARVYVDGALRGVVDTYSAPSLANSVLYAVDGLTAGSHTLTIEVTGGRNAASGGSWVWVDAFDVMP